jgi:methylmalonyl-CoA/ethylmalonyl-CoA epimerase
MFKEIDHIGIAVEDIDATLEIYHEKFEMAIQYRETVESQGVEAVLLEVGGGHVELLRPLGPDTPVGKFIEKRGLGMHHVAYRVDDVQVELDKLKALGVELIDETPRVGIRKSTVAFVHPQAAGFVLTELVTPAEDH